jgi:S1-C subfamily serine protease
MTRWSGALLALLLLLPHRARAQDLSDAATARAVRAAVRLQVDVRGGASVGSGTIIDARGYVLTNFHVLGFVRHGQRGGVPGSYFGDGEHVQIASVESDRESARTRWIGRVVRADVRLDLALVRIVSRADGTPIPEGTVFPTVELGTTADTHPGSSVWCFGYPLGVRTINVTGGHMTGFQMNTRGEVAWVRTDAEFNPGSSGGMLLDRRGRLIAVPTAVVTGDGALEPIEVARPVERIPREWHEALVRGPLDDRILTGVLALSANRELRDESVGDGGALDAPEIHYYDLPADRPGTITITPGFPVALIAPDGASRREAHGTMPIFAGDPPGSRVAVLVPRSDAGSTVELALRYELGSAVVGRSSPSVRGYGSAAAEPAPDRDRERVSVRGRLVDSASGQALAGMVLIASPWVDLPRHIELFLAGRVSDAEFRAALVTSSRVDATGAYELRGIPRGSYAAAGMSPGYRPGMMRIVIGPSDGAVVEAGPISLTR